MEKDKRILSEITIYNKYARYIPEENRRETWKELIDRNVGMHTRKYPQLKQEIEDVYDNFVRTKKVLPSMRSLQFGGKAIETTNARIFNCAFLPIESIRSFSEAMYLLLNGCGVGYSVQSFNIGKLPAIEKPNPNRSRKFLIQDDIIGWADAVRALMKSYTGRTKSTLVFDYSAIREKGALLVTSGGKAPGAGPLKIAIAKIEAVLSEKKDGERLSSVDCHDICCHIADAVLSGGIRRAALICLFDKDDHEMISSKTGNWWETNPQRGRANNSIVLDRKNVTEQEFLDIWKKVELSGSGEPGFYFSDNERLGTNPCCFVGETRLLTSDGYKEIGSCVGELDLINKAGDVVNGMVWSNGVKEVVELRLSNNTQIKCTPDHIFETNTRDLVEAKDLIGKRIMSFYTINQEVSEFTKYGFIQGDGGLSRLKSESHKGLEVCIGDKDSDIATLFGVEAEKGKKAYYLNGYNDVLKALGFSSDTLTTRTLPLTFNSWRDEDKKMFVKGMYSANGSVIKSGKRVAYKSVCRQLITELSEYLSSIGIESYTTTNKAKDVEFSNGTYTCKKSYDLNISKADSVISFAKEIGFVHQYKQTSLEGIIFEKSPLVVGVKEVGKAEVFDFNLDDDTHLGVVEGVIAHNCEISLKPHGFCNLTEINGSIITTQEEFNSIAKAASFIGSLQAGYTDFHYLNDEWRKNAEEESLLGVSITGIANENLLKLDFTESANVVMEENRRVSSLIGTNPARRATCVKPAGTTSLVLGTSSGIHAWHNDYYIRRMRVGKNESLYTHLRDNHPDMVEDEVFNPHSTAVISVPQKAPEGAITRHEDVFTLLERVKKVSEDWVMPGHVQGDNSHNVSCTISIKDGEWKSVGDWMWKNKDSYNGISVLPFDGGSYAQTPFEDCTKEYYEEKVKSLEEVDLSSIREEEDNTDLKGNVACGGGSCEIV